MTLIMTTTEQPITAHQIKEIMRNCAYQVETKNEWVQWATGDVNRTSLKSITHDEAIKIMHAQTGTTPLNELQENWAFFDKNNLRHKLILSLCHQAQWTTNDPTHCEVADLNRLSNFLKSDKSPVQKKLTLMDDKEVEKVIMAMHGIVKSKYK